jgi:F-type H+-transporting ATPase subunit gamma
MKMISAVKLRKSKERLLAFQPYSNKMAETVQNLVDCCQYGTQLPSHPVVQACIAPREEKNIRLVVVASDKGLCGGFNANVLKRATIFVNDCKSNIAHLDVVGKRAVEWANKHGHKIDKDYIGMSLPNIAHIAEDIVTQAVAQYELGEIDALYVVYNYFGSALTQIPMVQRVFPVDVENKKEDKSIHKSYLLEPNPTVVLSTLLSRFVETAFLRVLLESSASEH